MAGCAVHDQGGGAETGGAFAWWDVTTRPGEGPHRHVHDDVDETFYVLTGSITFHHGDESTKVKKGAFVYIPLGTPHTYTIHSKTVRMPWISAPSAFGDNIEATGKRVRGAGLIHEEARRVTKSRAGEVAAAKKTSAGRRSSTASRSRKI